ncbi:MAG: AIR synthase family protein, partial [Nitrososphaerota archaeon]
MRKLPIGKLPPDILKNLVLSRTGSRRGDVVLRPAVGEDAGAVKSGGKVYILSIDPITGSREMVGWLSVHASANDVAVSGGRPSWFSPTILIPPKSSIRDVDRIMRQVDRAAKSLDVAVVTGHTEVAPYITAPVVVGHMMGPLVGGRLIRSSGARPGDWIIMSKAAAIEGTAILATDFAELLRRRGVSRRVIRDARAYYRKISVVREALALARRGVVNAMHDPTEGGILGGLYELAEASGTGFRVMASEIPITPATKEICRALGLDPYSLISSGALLATTPRLERGILTRVDARPIGRVVKRREG